MIRKINNENLLGKVSGGMQEQKYELESILFTIDDKLYERFATDHRGNNAFQSLEEGSGRTFRISTSPTVPPTENIRIDILNNVTKNIYTDREKALADCFKDNYII